MTAQAAPEVGELFVGPRGTRHRITQLNAVWVGTSCAGGVMRSVFDAGPYPYQRDCQVCLPAAAGGVGSDILADLERARDIAVELEEQNDALIEFIRPIAGRGCLYKKSGGCSDCSSCHALRLLKRCSAVLS